MVGTDDLRFDPDEFVVSAGEEVTADLACSVPGDREAGMEATLEVIQGE